MATYYNEIEDNIKRSEEELNHLNQELMNLRSVENDMSWENYQREMEQINRYIGEEQRRLQENRDILKNYEILENSSRSLRILNGLLETEKDEQTRREINEEIAAKLNELKTSRDLIPEELYREFQASLNSSQQEQNITNRIEGEDDSYETINVTPDTGSQMDSDNTHEEQTDDESDINYKEEAKEYSPEEQLEIEKANLEQATKDYQESVEAMKRIFLEEKAVIENYGPFKTQKELDDFFDNYMKLKEAENVRFLDAKARMENAQNNIKLLETNILEQINGVYDTSDKASIEQTPRALLVTDDEKEAIEKNGDNLPKRIHDDNRANNNEHGEAPQGVPLIEGQKENYPALPEREPNLALPGREQYPALPPHKEKKKTPEKTEEPPKKKPKRGLMTIIEEITKDLELTRKDGKRYKASNIKVAKEFKQELKSGNYLYNVVHLVPAIIKAPIKFIKKVAGKIMFRKKAQERMEILKERVDNLSEEDLMTIYNEYRGSKVNQERFPTALNMILDEKMQEFVLGKVTKINADLERKYQDIFTTIRTLDAVDKRLQDKNISQKERNNLQNYREEIISGKAKEIESIRNGYIEANQWLSGGAHGFSEDMKAATTKLSCVGKRFSKDHDLDLDLLKQEAELERAEQKAIADNNDEKALRAFVEAESLLSSNTEISSSIYGKRSTGKKYYSPLAEQLDYRNDPFIRDLFTTVAVTSAAISAINALKTHGQESEELLTHQQAEADRVNQANDQTMDQVNQIGNEIAGKREVMSEGMKAQSQQDVVTVSDELERAALDKAGWGSVGTSGYKAIDQPNHEFYNDFYDQTQQAISDVAAKYSQGSMTQQDVIESLSEIARNTHETLGKVNSECLDILRDYASTHQHIDLNGVQEAMTYMSSHPDAIPDMYQAMVDVTNMGDTLSGMTAEHVAALQSLPSDLQSTIIGAASAGALAYRVSSEMDTNVKKGKYGNSVTDMVDEYAYNKAQDSTNDMIEEVKASK